MIVRRLEEPNRVDFSPLGQRARRLQRAARAEGECVWLALEAGRVWGYVLTAPVPGLPGLHEIEFCVVPARRRQGIGSLIWEEVRAALAGEPDIRRVSAALDEGGPLTAFLTARGFRPEHEEWEMRRERLDDLPEPVWPAGYGPATYSRPAAVRQFIALYDASFGPTAWYQPFSQGEVAETLEAASDLLFAVTGSEPVGAAWIRLQGTLGVIEPIGIVPGHQGQGVGRALLATALIQMRQRGAKAARLGVWRQNETAIRLYQQMGFRHSKSRTYLAYDLGDSSAGRRLR